jgi:hypothetical protein
MFFVIGCEDVTVGPETAEVETKDDNGNDPPDSQDDQNDEKKESENDEDSDEESDEDSIKVFIVDNTGKKWDVTHAQKKYGMDPEKFQFGLGPFAIKPILNPRMLAPGDKNYPDDSEEFLTIGIKLNGEARSYGISVLSYSEIADDRFGDTYVAAAY